jgi:TrmH family RNA methyltransferase
VTQISSLSNPRIKAIRALAERKVREVTGQFFVEGVRMVADALHCGASVETLVVAPELLVDQAGRALVASYRRNGVPSLEVSAEVYRAITSKFTLKYGPQGVGAVIQQQWSPLSHVRPERGLCALALDAVEDPGNLGTILRTADAVGVGSIILLGHTTDPYNPMAVRASLGTIFLSNLVRTSFADFSLWIRQQRCLLVGTSGQAQLDYRDADYQSPLVVLMGSERSGLSAEQQALCDATVRIPMVGRSDSLNLAVATGVILYHVFHRQHRVEQVAG